MAALAFSAGQRFYRAIFLSHKAGVEGAVRTFRTATAKVRDFHQSLSLRFDSAQYRGDRKPYFRCFQTAAPKIGDGLDMDTANMGCAAKRKPQNITQGVIINPGSNRRHQYHRKICFLTVVDGFQFDFQ